MSVFFDGRQITTPTTASAVDDSAMNNKNLTVGNVAAFVGVSQGGKPKTALRFGSPAEAKATLISGDLLNAVLAAFDPSAQTGSPTTVVAVPVQPSTRATGDILDVQGVPAITLTSTNYGSLQNKISFKVESITGGRRVSIKGTDDKWVSYNSDATSDALTVTYSGSATSVTLTVGTSSVSLSVDSVSVPPFYYADYPTLQSLADRISSYPDFTAVVLNGSGGKPSSSLDRVAGASLVSTPITLRRGAAAVVDWINSSIPSLTATRPIAGRATATQSETFLSGGTDGTPITSDWSAGFEALQLVSDCYWITPVSSSGSIHAMADTHCAYMSTVGKRERRAVCGTALGTTDDAALTAAKALNSDRTALVHLGHYAYNADGALTLYPPYITAAMIAGAFSGVNPGTPLTNKTLKVRGWERDLRNPTDTDVLINGGVLAVENTDQGYKVVKSISTWLTNDNYNRVELSTGWAVDFVARNVREALDVLRGEKNNRLLLARAVSITESILRELAREEPSGPGVLAGDADNPAYKGITATIEGDVLRVEFQCSPVIPCNYVLATIHAVPYTGTATA